MNVPKHDLDMLVVAPHPDDAELGMGGAIAKMLDLGWKVGVLDLTNGEPTPFGDIETRETETKSASQALGITWREKTMTQPAITPPPTTARLLRL